MHKNMKIKNMKYGFNLFANTQELKKESYPSISIIRLKRSNSEAPGNNGSPRNNSATMHPKDHISIAVVYL